MMIVSDFICGGSSCGGASGGGGGGERVAIH